MSAIGEKINFLRTRVLDDAPSVSLKMPWWLRVILAALGGACIFLSFPDYNLFFLAWFALALELLAIDGLTGKRAFWLGMLAGTVTNIGGFYWIEKTVEVFGHMPVVVSWILCILLCMVQALVFGLWSLLARGLRTKHGQLTMMAAFVAVEFLWPMIFPWYIANSQHNFLPALQIADIFGVLGVSLWVMCVNMIVYDAVRVLWLRRQGMAARFDRVFYGVAGGYVVLCLIYGPIRMAQVDAVQAQADKIRIGMVEGDLGIWQIEPPEKIKNNLFIHHSLSKQLEEDGAELIVWPEAGYQSTYIWASRLKDASLTELELDALYAPWFVPEARRVYAVIDEMFGESFRQTVPVHQALWRAFSSAAQGRKLASMDVYYTAYANGYGVICRQDPPFIHRCPYVGVTPDDVTWYYRSPMPLGQSRMSDVVRHTSPYDLTAPIRDNKAAFLFGTLTIEGEASKVSAQRLYHDRTTPRTLYNATKLLESDGRVIGSYHKKYLMPIGEYMPLGEYFPQIYALVPEAGRLTKGDAPHVLPFRGYKIGPIICYEDILPRYVNALSKLEPNVLINQTDDAWFGKTTEPWQHLALAALRSVEHRKWLVRSTNTGVSAFVDANGRIVSHTSLEDAEAIAEDVPMMPGRRTIYSYIGDLLGWLAAAWIAFVSVLTLSGRRRKDVAKVDEGSQPQVDEGSQPQV